ncbi:hypothetical protein FH972_009636 [Carpinus fangiana]|uniref:Uncharacterized protein n=1 Tax=Carpinus fangiana TaxID=176857 RepID=A0A660KS15_9ROSI|nr:hypothetical protein FH972_009636 [Carpinus fangiana]
MLTAMKSVVGVDATNHGCSEDHKLWLLSGEEDALVGQVELGVGEQDKVGKAQVAELPHDGKQRRPSPEMDDHIERERERERERTKTRLDRGR